MKFPAELADDLSQDFQEDAGRLFAHLAEFAALMLGSRKVFLPAAAAVTTDGELEVIATPPAGFTDGVEMFAFLVTAARQSRDSWRSAAFVRAVVDPEYGDALEFQLDSASPGPGIAGLLAYTHGGLWRELVFGDLVVQLNPKVVWA